jgi:hypothetical protein
MNKDILVKTLEDINPIDTNIGEVLRPSETILQRYNFTVDTSPSGDITLQDEGVYNYNRLFDDIVKYDESNIPYIKELTEICFNNINALVSSSANLQLRLSKTNIDNSVTDVSIPIY